MSECAHTTRVSPELAAGLKVKVFRFPEVHVRKKAVVSMMPYVIIAVTRGDVRDNVIFFFMERLLF